MKYKEWLNIWLENYVKPTAKMRTYERYSQIVKQQYDFVCHDSSIMIYYICRMQENELYAQNVL